MQPVYQAENLIDAHLVKGRLENEGVPAWVRGEHLAGGMGELPVSGLLAVCVARDDVQKAKQHLERWARERAAIGGSEPGGAEDPDGGAVPSPAG